ncbi:unnamed protein product [Meloidogyne enterolobii]|uniref:Uncharacterized protein n=1 Tax=Meloidogyne enterolobii TaxID=390850 RepID=A0ACB1A6H3_MELEN
MFGTIRKYLLSEDEQTVNSTYENTALECDSNNLFVKNCKNSSDNNSLIYANYGEISRLQELQEIDRRPYPPFPDASSSPLLVYFFEVFVVFRLKKIIKSQKGNRKK